MRSFHRSGLVVAFLGSLAAAACAGAGDDADSAGADATEAQKANLFDVNDVSILFQFGGSPSKVFPEITMDEKLPNGHNLLSDGQFTQVTGFAKQQGIQFTDGGDKRANWRVFAMRFDPCAPGINTTGPLGVNGDKTKCNVQVRLIMQPLSGDGTTMQDITAHFVYNIGTLEGPGKVDLAALRADLAVIKAASAKANAPTAGKPLGVHPGLVIGDADTGNAVHAFINKHVGEAKSMALAFMGLQNDGAEPWTFFAGAVVNPANPADTNLANAAFVPLASTQFKGLPNLPPGTLKETFQPFASPKVSVNPINLSTASLFGQKADPQSIAFQIENPTKTHFFTADCVSCHTSTQLGAAFGTASNASRVRVPAGITGYVSPSVQQNSSWNLRNFGWFAGDPSVSLRTVNETVEIVELMNADNRVTGDDRAAAFFGPGNDCTAVDDKVFDCFRKNADGKGGATCMSTNHCVPFPLSPPEAPATSTTDPLTPLAPGDANPCDASPDQSDLQVTTDPQTGVTAAILGKKSECLSRSFGAFRSDDGTIQVICAAGSTCVVNTPKAQTLISGVDAQRFNARLTKVSASRQFEAKSTDGQSDLFLACSGGDATLSCSIVVSAPAAPVSPPAVPIVVNPGLYGSLAIAVHNGIVTGSVRENGCEFTVAGQIPNANPIPLTVFFKGGSTTGQLTANDDGSIAFTTSSASLPTTCLDLVSSANLSGNLPLRANISAAVSAFRTVKSSKAFFHTTPTAPARPAFVIAGQTVQELGDNDGGFANVRFTSDQSVSTAGFIQESDLTPLGFTAPGL